MYRVLKRDGVEVDFDVSKISAAIEKAFIACEKKYHPTVVDMLALGRETAPPEIVVVPVGEGEIDTRLDAVGPVCVQDLLGDVGPGIRMEGTLL